MGPSRAVLRPSRDLLGMTWGVAAVRRDVVQTGVQPSTVQDPFVPWPGLPLTSLGGKMNSLGWSPVSPWRDRPSLLLAKAFCQVCAQQFNVMSCHPGCGQLQFWTLRTVAWDTPHFSWWDNGPPLERLLSRGQLRYRTVRTVAWDTLHFSWRDNTAWSPLARLLSRGQLQ